MRLSPFQDANQKGEKSKSIPTGAFECSLDKSVLATVVIGCPVGRPAARKSRAIRIHTALPARVLERGQVAPAISNQRETFKLALRPTRNVLLKALT